MNRIAVLLIFLIGFGSAWSWQGSRADARVATLTAAHEKQSGDAARAAAKKLKDAQDRADQIVKAATLRDAEQDQKLQEVQHALKTATRNRPCLGGAALRLLGESPGLRLGPAEPASAGALHGGSAAPAANPAEQGDYSTDTEIAGWIATAGTLYEKCRARIRDIRTWEDGQP
ncbi:MAG: hypothetical protein Q7U97_14490 [Rhodocyclaceae bacterium]|nr:hypothetical protein [Rhodocyclaceae bacterium]